MRKFLLASVATLGTGGLTGVALAQPAGGPVGAPTQGQQAYPAAPAPVAYVNENNNYQAPALPGPLANPTPGTIVVHFNGKVVAELQATWTSVDSRFAGTFPATPANPVVGTVKLEPQTVPLCRRRLLSVWQRRPRRVAGPRLGRCWRVSPACMPVP